MTVNRYLISVLFQSAPCNDQRRNMGAFGFRHCELRQWSARKGHRLWHSDGCRPLRMVHPKRPVRTYRGLLQVNISCCINHFILTYSVLGIAVATPHNTSMISGRRWALNKAAAVMQKSFGPKGAVIFTGHCSVTRSLFRCSILEIEIIWSWYTTIHLWLDRSHSKLHFLQI